MAELADIIAPVAAPPAPLPYGWIALGIGVLLLILGWLLIRWLRRTRHQRQARSGLQRAEAALKSGTADPRQTAHAIAHALAHMPPYRAAVLQHDAAWAPYLQALHQARFAPQAEDRDAVLHLLIQARHMVKEASC